MSDYQSKHTGMVIDLCTEKVPILETKLIKTEENIEQNKTDILSAVRYLPTQKLYLGDNIITSDTLITLGAGWSGDIGNGLTHTSGNTEMLEINAETEQGEKYVINYDVSTPSEGLSLTIGEEPFVDTYNGATSISIGIISDGGGLKIVPKSNYSGTITNLSIRKVQESGTEFIHETKNVNRGSNVDDITGFWNVAIGTDTTMLHNQNGSRNIAIGNHSMRELKSGTRNVCVGTFSMPFVTEGDRNIAIGADTLYNVEHFDTSAAYDNVAIGKATMANGELVEKNIAVGANAMSRNTNTASYNTCVGYNAGYYASTANTHVGYNAGYFTKGYGNVSLGSGAGSDAYNTGNQNICIGHNAGIKADGSSSSDVKTIDNSIVIGTGLKAKKSNQAMFGLPNQELILCGKKIVFNDDGTVTWTEIT